MVRPTDWDVLDLAEDPTPGDSFTSRGVARTWVAVADAAERAETGIRSLLGDQAVLTWLGKAGDAFRDHGSKLPDQLAKAKKSYRIAADAMTWWAGQLTTCQADADRALAQGRVARADLNTAQAQLAGAQSRSATASAASTKLHTPPPDGSTAPPPDPGQVAAAARAATQASSAVTSAQSAVGDAQSRLEAAKRLAADAASARDKAGRTTSGKLHDAADAGIPNDSFWHKLGEAISKAWHVLVEIAKVVVAVLSIVCLIIGGPLAWVLLAAALIVLADTAIKYAQGKATLWDVALAALSCIPMTKGLTTLAELKASGGLLEAGGLILRGGKNAVTGLLRSANQLRVGGVPAVTAMFGALGDARAAFSDGAGLSRFSAFSNTMESAGTTAKEAAWADHVSLAMAGDPAKAARMWQGSGGYPGIDPYANSTWTKGTHVEAGWPGTSGYTAPGGTAQSVGHDATSFNQGLQVGPRATGNGVSATYRPEVMTFRANTDIPQASGVTHANPHLGDGGIGQNYVPDFNAKLLHGDITAIDAAGNPLHASLDSHGNLQLTLPSGAAGHGAPMINTATTVAKTPTVMPPGRVLLVPLQTPAGVTAPTR